MVSLITPYTIPFTATFTASFSVSFAAIFTTTFLLQCFLRIFLHHADPGFLITGSADLQKQILSNNNKKSEFPISTTHPLPFDPRMLHYFLHSSFTASFTTATEKVSSPKFRSYMQKTVDN